MSKREDFEVLVFDGKPDHWIPIPDDREGQPYITNDGCLNLYMYGALVSVYGPKAWRYKEEIRAHNNTLADVWDSGFAAGKEHAFRLMEATLKHESRQTVERPANPWLK